MISETLKLGASNDGSFASTKFSRKSIQSQDIDVLTNIYNEEINIAIWKRKLSEQIKLSINDFISVNSKFEKSMTVSPQNVYSSLSSFIGKEDYRTINDNISELVEMFCCLFDLKRAGLRLTVLDKAMCPKFHVDRVPCRLISTFQGEATEWLPHEIVNRDKLGHGSEGKPDHLSGLFSNESEIKQLNSGDVALLKGEIWPGNQNAGLVHRSPTLQDGERRLLLTLDFIS